MSTALVAPAENAVAGRPTPAPADNPMAGIFPGISRRAYDAIQALNFSTVKHCRRSPAHARHAQLNPKPSTPAQELGTLIHCYLLEPERFARDHVALPDLTQNLKTRNGETPKVPTATAEYKARLAEFGQANMGRTIVSAADMEICRAIGDSVAACANAAEYLGHLSALEAEVGVVWQDRDTGLWCKGLVDYFNGRIVIDLKTTDDASPGAFARSVAQHHWHLQAAWYLTGLAAVGRPATQFLHVAVETDAPHGVAVYELDTAALDQGIRDARLYLDAWHRCVQCGHWSAYPDQVRPLSIPRYAMTKDGIE